MKSVTIYSTPTCGFCQQLKAFLKDKEIPFEDHNVMEEEQAKEEMQSLTNGATSVPVIVFNKGLPDQKIQVGFNPENLQLTLGL